MPNLLELWLKILIRYRYFTQEFITHFHEIFWVSLIEIKCFILYFQESLTEPSFIYGLSTSQVISGSPLLDALGQDKSFSSSRYTYWNYFFGKIFTKISCSIFFVIFFSVGEVEKNPEYKELRKHLGIMHYILRTNPDLKISKKLLVIYLRVKDLL